MPTLPYNYLNWDESAVSLAIFLRYHVYRRLTGDTVWTQIARVPDRAITYYQDYLVGGANSYDYSVTQVVDVSGEDVESAHNVVAATNDFSDSWLHDIANPGYFAQAILLQAQYTPEQDIAFVQPWGRQTPTMHIGNKDSQRAGLSVIGSWSAGAWDDLKAMQARQRTVGAMLCYRGYRGDRLFCQIAGLSRQDALGDVVDAQVELVEVYYDEEVS